MKRVHDRKRSRAADNAAVGIAAAVAQYHDVARLRLLDLAEAEIEHEAEIALGVAMQVPIERIRPRIEMRQ